ncbi:DnaD domain protein [Limosilactobacillus reuteri]|uniref:helix-turn-helix domain-containing protein n=1 Tax=Limosilactobacillus reuteri TaxID=1598 RepID=UPI000D701548|nr:helix-turn-helix domain-containing protein [Limosilactobacillus reuteri]PWT39736.1 DnaD domain protein [Limosilactobacillus reuteri]
MEQPSYYSILTANVRYDKELKANEKLLFSEITALSNRNGYCHANNNYFANLYNVSKTSISNWINHLKERGYLKVEMIKDGKEIKERRLFPISTPIKENFNTPSKNLYEGNKEKFNSPIKENFKENITSINNTSTNNTSAGTQSASSENPFDLIHEYHINANEGDHLSVFLNAINQLGEPLVCWAIRQTADGPAPHSWSYLKKVFNRLKADNISSVEEANKRAEEHKRGKNSGSITKSRKKRIYD